MDVAKFMAVNGVGFEGFERTGWGAESDAVLTCLADLLVYLDMQVDTPEKEHVTTEVERLATFFGEVIEKRGNIVLSN